MVSNSHGQFENTRLTNRSNDVADDVVLGTLLSQGLCEANHGELSRRVVGLAKVAKETSSRGSVDDTTVLLLPEVGPGSSCALVSTLDVHLVDEVPIFVLHVLEANITEDTGVVNENVDAAECLDGGFDDLVTVLDTVVIGNSLAASGLDFVDNDIGSLEIEYQHHDESTARFRDHSPLPTGPRPWKSRPDR